MIEKFVMIRGIGLLHDALPSGAINLSPITVVYAENGRGKSTFASICHSLATANTALILNKETIGGSNNLEAHFQIANQHYIFRDEQWSKICPDILVFDDLFVERNVCIGSRVEPSQRENLLEFAVGERGVKLKNRIDRINKRINDLNSKIRELGRLIDQHRGPFALEEFIQLVPKPNVDEELEKVNHQLQRAENLEAIRQRPLPECIQLPKFDLPSIELLLTSSLETIAKEAERKVKDHIAQHLDADGEKWLQQGLGYLEKTTTCPFCGRDTSGLDLVKAYKEYFSIAYNNFKNTIEETLRRIETEFGTSIWISVESTLRLNENVKGAWADQPDLKFPEDLDLDTSKSVFMTLRDAVVAALKQKISAPLSQMPVSEELCRAVEQYEAARSRVDNYTEAVKSVRRAIEELKNSLETVDKQQLQVEVSRLKAAKRRFQSEVAAYCQRYKTLQKRKSTFEDGKSRKREELDTYTNSLLGDYKDEINRLLREFNAGFAVSEIEVAHVGGTPRTEYGLQVMGKTIPASSKSGQAFSATLSSGDRKTLALAFFLARLQLDPQRNQRIVVIDDPVSSLDVARRRATRDILAKLAEECNQIIVLSHDPVFLRDLWERVNSDSVCSLCLKRHGHYSVIEKCDLYRICRDEYCTIYESLIRYLEEGPTDNEGRLAEDIRKYLEHNLRNRFPIELEGARSLGEMIGCIRNSPDQFAQLRDRLNDFNKLNEFTSLYHHMTSDRLSPPTDAELQAMVKLALEIGRG